MSRFIGWLTDIHPALGFVACMIVLLGSMFLVFTGMVYARLALLP